MGGGTSATSVFLEHLPEGTSVDLSRLEGVLDEMIRAGRDAWPSIPLDSAVFVAHVADRIPTDQPVVDTLETLHYADLHLACACANGDNQAVREFHTRYDDIITRAARRVEAQGVQADETRQVLITHLLLQRENRPPAIALYSGQGTLKSYLRVAALHKALHLLKKSKRAPQGVDFSEVMMVADTDDDPELTVLKDTYRKEFKTAFHDAMGLLSSEDRNLLRYHYLSGLNTRQIAQLTSMNQSTVVRHLARVRGRLLAVTRTRLMADLGLGQSKFNSILKLVQSQLDVSIERVLTPTRTDVGDEE